MPGKIQCDIVAEIMTNEDAKTMGYTMHGNPEKGVVSIVIPSTANPCYSIDFYKPGMEPKD